MQTPARVVGAPVRAFIRLSRVRTYVLVSSDAGHSLDARSFRRPVLPFAREDLRS